MANNSNKKTKQTLRQSIESDKEPKVKKRRLRSKASSASSGAKGILRKEVKVPVPKGKAGKILDKRVRFIPSYFRNSWSELKNVVWPDRPTTIKLTFAVFAFAIIFAVGIAIVDFGLDKIFRYLILER